MTEFRRVLFRSENQQVLDEKGPRRVSPFLITSMLPDTATGLVAIALGADGANFAVTAACATGGAALGEAGEIVARGDAEVMIAGGFEAPLRPIFYAGFQAMRALAEDEDPTKACKPFDLHRNGFVISEGAGILILEELDHALARGARIYAEWKGAGTSNDAFDMVAAAEDGDCAAAEKLLTEDARASDPCESEDFRLLATEDVESDVHDASIDGSTASVPADFTSQAGSSTYTFVLEKVDGEWLVASYDVARSASSEGPSVTAPTDGPSPSGSPSAGGSSTAGAVPDEPTAVVEAFLDSAFAGDCATAEDLVTSAYLADEGSCDAAEIPTELGDSVKWDVGDATVDAAAGTATVPVEITIYGSSQKSDFELVREGGRWKISDAG